MIMNKNKPVLPSDFQYNCGGVREDSGCGVNCSILNKKSNMNLI